MKKVILSFLVQVVLVSFNAFAASSVADLSSGPAEKEEVEIPKQSDSMTGRRVKSEANLYYTGDKKLVDYQKYGNCTEEDGCENTSRSVRAEAKRVSDERKYHIASPFFQPKEKQFTSVTEIYYRNNSVDFEILPGTGAWEDNTGTYKYSGTSIVENLSFGIEDDLSILGIIQYTSADLGIDWDTVLAPYNRDKDDSSKIDVYGIGVQWRFMDNSVFIGTVLGAYQKLVDTADVMTVDAKFGLKLFNSTLYGFGRGYLLSWEGTGYGFGLTNQYNQTELFVLDEDAETSFYYDLGAGLFTAINSDWSTDINLAYSYGEWHSQIYGRAAVAYQPIKNISVSLYGKFVLLDTADGFDESTVIYKDSITPATTVGTAEFGKYSDIAIGLQVGILF